MQFKASIDYGLRAVLYLAIKGITCSSKDIAQDMSIPRDYLIQLAQLLRNEGIIEARPGKNGGYRLAKDPADITLMQVIEALSEESNGAGQARRESRAHAKIDAAVKPAYDLVIKNYEDYFSEITIAALLDQAKA